MYELAILSPRLTDVLSRIRFDVLAALKRRNRGALAFAALACARCRLDGKCRRWIASHRQGEDNQPPAFCPIGNFMRACEPERPHAPRRNRGRGRSAPKPA
jgi:hypothetical protein